MEELRGRGSWTGHKLNNSVAAFLQDLFQQLSPCRPLRDLSRSCHFAFLPFFTFSSTFPLTPDATTFHPRGWNQEWKHGGRGGPRLVQIRNSRFARDAKEGERRPIFSRAHVLPMKNERKYQIRFSHQDLLPPPLPSLSLVTLKQNFSHSPVSSRQARH